MKLEDEFHSKPILTGQNGANAPTGAFAEKESFSSDRTLPTIMESGTPVKACTLMHKKEWLSFPLEENPTNC